MNFGYGIAVRQKGFTAPAAGKTGTGHDAWFAAYTSNLLCVVWVGNDDYTDIKLSGAVAAAPIWAEFMNRAAKLPQYSDMQPFTPLEGISNYRLDKNSNLLADETCPNDYTAAFLDGTQPQSTCSRMGGEGNLGEILGNYNSNGSPNGNGPEDGNPGDGQEHRHRNFFQKLFGGGGDHHDNPPPPPPQ